MKYLIQLNFHCLDMHMNHRHIGSLDSSPAINKNCSGGKIFISFGFACCISCSSTCCAFIQPYFTELLEAALKLLKSLRYSGETGCPNYVQNLTCGEYNELIHKDVAIMIMKGVLDAEKSYFGELPVT